ncbi:MAG TPA: hypothetical protein VHL98_15830 [Microvirga sp.]|jgi:localization factor PodJL|nr:hypothetical protein [Microvirga sp.]
MTRPYTTGSGDPFDFRDPFRESPRRPRPDGAFRTPDPAGARAEARRSGGGRPDPASAWDPEEPARPPRSTGPGKARLVDDVAGILAGLRDRLDARDGGMPVQDQARRAPRAARPRAFDGDGMRDGPGSGPAEPPGLGTLREEIRDLRRGMGALATRSEILDMERQIRGLAAEVVETRSPGAITALAERLEAVQAEIGRLAGEIPENLHQRIGSAIELLNWKIDSARGVEGADLRVLNTEVAGLRRGLAELAEPRRLDELAHEVASLRALVADLRLRFERDGLAGLREDLSSTRGEIVAQGDDLAALRTTFEGMRRALVGEGGAAASLPVLRHEIGQRLDALLRRPAPESLSPIAHRLAAIEDGLARLRAQPAPDLAAMAASFEQVATLRGREADRLAGRFDEVDGMLRQIRERTEPGAAVASALDASQASLAALDRKVEAVAAKFDLDSLSALRDQITAARGPSGDAGADPALLERLQALDARLRDLAAREPERLEPLREQLAAIASRLDRLSFARPAGSSPEAGAPVSLPDDLAGRLARIEDLLAAQRPVAEGLVAGVERLGRLEESLQGRTPAFDQIAQSLQGRAPALDQIAQTLERLDDGLRHVAQVSDTASVEILLRDLGGRLDEIHASREQVERLEAQIAGLAAALERSGRADPAIELLHQTIGEAVAEMRSLREDAPRPDGSRALPELDAIARDLRDLKAEREGRWSPSDLEAIARDLQDLRAEGAAREDRTHEALAAIQAALGSLAQRAGGRDGPARPDPANDADRPPPADIVPDAASRIPTAAGAEPSWTGRFRAALQRRRGAEPAAAPAPMPVPPPPVMAGPRDLDETLPPESLLPEAPALVEAAAASPEPGLPKATLPEFRPIVIGASSPEAPARIRSSFIAALRRNQAAGEGSAPDGAPPKAPGRRLQSVLLVGAAAAALAAGAWSFGGPARIGDAVAAVAGRVDSWRSPAAPVRPKTVAQAGTSKPAPERAKHPEPIGTPAATGTPASGTAPTGTPSAGASLTAARDPSAEAARAPEASASPVETGSLPASAARNADDLPAGIPARLKPAVLAGNPAALYELASLLVQGREMPKDPALGARILERAAQAGLVPALFSLGQLYETGVGVAQDLAQAQVWYRRAAERGNTNAMQNLGVLIAAGSDGKTDYPAAIPWFRQAADLGVRDSQFNLAVILAWGMGTPRNPVEAYKWFALAARAGDQEAAAKRDEIARELSPADLAAAKALAENWRARTTDRAANTVPPLPQGMSDIPAPKPLSGRV